MLTNTPEVSMVGWLNQIVFTWGGDAVSWSELLGFVTGGLAVWLTVRASIANFPVGIANSAFFLVLFATARLWADSGLQVVYIALGFAGWWQWARGRGRALPVGQAAGPLLAGCLGFVAVGTAGLTVLLAAAHDAAPFWDALTTSLSLAAQWLLNARKLQTWWLWIAADCIYVPLYLSRSLYLTAAVYVLFLGLCVAGLGSWRRAAAPVALSVPAEMVRP